LLLCANFVISALKEKNQSASVVPVSVSAGGSQISVCIYFSAYVNVNQRARKPISDEKYAFQRYSCADPSAGAKSALKTFCQT
jgi:hypothetical protein